MIRSRPLIATLTALTLLVCGLVSEAQAGKRLRPLTARAVSYHWIPPAFAGFSAPFRENAWQALSPQLHLAAAGLTPGAIRVFGGTTANYWNWETGKFFDRPGVPNGFRRTARHMKAVHLADWARLVSEANATPVFDLNMVTSTLSSQLAMLHAAQSLGMPINWVELGNEVFLREPPLERAFPTGQAYGKEATRWIQAIRAEFPAAQIAAVGRAAKPANDSRRAHWNRRVLKTLRGEDALTFHTYWFTPLGRLSPGRLSKIFAAPIRRSSLLRSAGLRHLPRGVDAWLTEWFVEPSPAMRGTWANGLADAEYLLELLGERRVRMETLHPLIGEPSSAALFGNGKGFGGKPRTVQFAPTAVGEAVGALYPLLTGGGRVSPLRFRHGPEIPGTPFGAIRAVAVKGRGALLLNLTSRRRRVRLAGRPGCAKTLTSVWARPGVRVTGVQGRIHHHTGPVEHRIRLPAHSVNRLSC
jgi:hypothetical protein